MKFVAHRGNLEGPNSEWENHPNYIEETIQEGFDVEIDVWSIKGSYYLGHDKPEHRVKLDWFLSHERSLWCHAKNLEALQSLLLTDFHCFWHQEDTYTLTNQGWIWTYPGNPLSYHSIAVMPERGGFTVPSFESLISFDCCRALPESEEEYLVKPIAGICSDYLLKYHDKYKHHQT